jgi:DNA-binding NtrC family response regulator
MSAQSSTTTSDVRLPIGSALRRFFLTQVYADEQGVVWRHHRIDGHRVVIGRDPGPGGIAFDDEQASRAHCELVFDRARGRYRLRDLKSKNGTYVHGRIVDELLLEGCVVLRLGGSLWVFNEVETPLALDAFQVPEGVSPRRAVAERLIDLVAPDAVSVMVVGPTGAGKDLLAQRLHAASGRRGALVPVNCAGLTREMVGSELFGHVRGAFTGAHTHRAGLFAEAAGGTLFLDEVADLPLEQQPALLRAVQNGRVRPVGADREVAVDVRIVSATHQDLVVLQQSGRFRDDLYARLAGVTVALPGLSDRREEILGLLVAVAPSKMPSITRPAAEALLLHDWPLNVREVQQVAAVVRMFMAGASRVDLEHLPASVIAAYQRALAQNESRPSPPMERAELVRVIADHEGNVARVARSLGKTRQQIYRLAALHRIDVKALRDDRSE